MPVLIQNRSFIGVKYAKLNKIVFTSSSFVFLGAVPYTELPPLPV